MKKLLITIALLLVSYIAIAEDEAPLKIAVARFNPPYSMQSANGQMYGFDIEMMEWICNSLNKKCSYTPMNFDELIPSVIENKYDIALGGITITTDRAKKVYMTYPYLSCYARFIGKSDMSKKDISLSLLNDSKIGVEAGTVFEDQIRILGAKDATVLEFPTEENAIDALANDELTLVMLDNPTALYWQNHTSGVLSVLGTPIQYGFGLGVVVNPANQQLMNDVNNALKEFIKSDNFKKAENNYFGFTEG